MDAVNICWDWQDYDGQGLNCRGSVFVRGNMNLTILGARGDLLNIWWNILLPASLTPRQLKYRNNSLIPNWLPTIRKDFPDDEEDAIRQGTSSQYQNSYLDLAVWYSICQLNQNIINK